MDTFWSIAGLERNQSNGIVNVYWLVQKEEEGVMGSYNDFCSFTPDLSSVDYVSYENVTEQQVVSWVKDSLGPAKVLAIEADIDKQIADVITPLSTGVPW
tara:strand:+ start:432 stop:731 length:300 start_codon:yes stop_codon:yes gene_type:complete